MSEMSQVSSGAPNAPSADGAPDPLTPAGRILVGGLAGAVAGAAMFVVLGLIASGQGRGFWYPLHAVQALMSGRRVLPDNRGVLRGASPLDVVTGPALFLLPAVAVGLATAWWLSRRARTRTSPDPLWVTVAVAAVLTAVPLVIVLGLGFRVSPEGVQRMSSGKGVRLLGLGAWIAAHAVYLTVLVAILAPLTRAGSDLVARRQRTVAAREDQDPDAWKQPGTVH